jgi:hypothetical protein
VGAEVIKDDKLISILTPFFAIIFALPTSGDTLKVTTLERTAFNVDGKLIYEITAATLNNLTGNPILNQPSGIDIKRIDDGNEYLTVLPDCRWSRLIYIKTISDGIDGQDIIDSYGNAGPDSQQFVYPTAAIIGGYNGVMNTSIDYIYVADKANGRIVVLSYDSKLNKVSWHQFIGNSVLIRPRGLAYYDKGTESRDDDQIFVTDIDLSQILRFSIEGNLLGQYGIKGFDTAQFITPKGICFGPSGSAYANNLYITDTYNFKICLYDFKGTDLAFIKESYFAPETTGELLGITSDDQGLVYIANSGRNRIIMLSPFLEPLAEFDSTMGSDFTFNSPSEIKYFEKSIVVIDKYTDSTGFKLFNIIDK